MIQAELGPELEDYVRGLVADGKFASNDAALRQGISMIREREEAIAKFDAAIAVGRADIEAGRVHSLEEVREALRARTAAELSTKE